MRSAVTMNDIASRAGVSQATVSFVLNNRREGINIPQATRQRVLDAARELGYRRNQLARAMVTGKSRILGVITTPHNNENVIRVLTGALEATHQHDYLLKILHVSHDEIDDTTVARCQEWRLAGAIILGLGENIKDYLFREFQQAEIAAAFVDNAPRRDSLFRVVSDDEQGIRDVLDHLLGLGHRRIAFLGGRPSVVSRWREETFRAVLAENSLTVPETWIRHSSWFDQSVIEQEARILLTPPELPTAVVCASDSGAMVVQRLARAMGLRLPDELSVTGYGDSNLSAFADPSLTTVDQSFHRMGYEAALHLIQLAENMDAAESGTAVAEKIIPTQLLLRASTAPAPEVKR